jgi:hypothetical protein
MGAVQNENGVRQIYEGMVKEERAEADDDTNLF